MQILKRSVIFCIFCAALLCFPPCSQKTVCQAAAPDAAPVQSDSSETDIYLGLVASSEADAPSLLLASSDQDMFIESKPAESPSEAVLKERALRMETICSVFLALVLSLILNYYLMRRTSALPKVTRESMLESIDITFDISNEKFDYVTTRNSSSIPGGVYNYYKNTGNIGPLVKFILVVILLLISFLFKIFMGA